MGRATLVRGMAVMTVGVLATACLAIPASADPPPSGQQCAPPATSVVTPVPWPQQRLQPQRAWQLTQGQGVTVAVIDSGVDASDPQLAGHVRSGTDVINGSGTANTDCLGHGTFVASIIAAQPAPGVGFAGIAPGVSILPIRQTNNGQDGTLDGMATAIVDAVDAGAKVINISASSTVSDQNLVDAVNFANAHDVLIVAAADNEAQQGNPTTFPASLPGVIAVGAINEQGQRANFSETGAFIDLVAPGTDVLGLGINGPGQLVGQGTSFATPFVAGVAALVRAYRPTLSAAQVKRRLEATADHPAAALPDPQFGFGVVNPYNALTESLPDEAGAAAATSAPAALHPELAAPVSNSSADVSLLIGAGGLALLVLIGLAVFVVKRGRQRGWQPGRVGSGGPTS